MKSFAAALLLAVGFCAPAPAAGEGGDGARALARLDSLQKLVSAEEARVHAEPRSEIAWARLARAWYQVGDHARARQALEQALLRGAHEYDTMLLLGRSSRTELRLAEAERWLMRATRAQPESWEAHEDLGLTLYLEGKYADAVAEWRRAAALPGTQSPLRTGLLEVLERTADQPYGISGPPRDRLPFAFPAVTTLRRPLPSVALRINGRGPWLFQIDAGSSEVVLGRKLATELGVAVVPGGESGVFAGGRAARLDYTRVDSLGLGRFTVRHVPCAVSDHPGLADRNGARGTLGLEVLRRFRFCFDYPDSALLLELAAAADTARPPWIRSGDVAHEVPVLLRGTHLIVAEGTLGRSPEHPILLDTGGPGVGYAAAASALAEARIPVDTTDARVGTAGGAPIRYYPLPAARVCIGGACVDSLPGVYGIFPEALEQNPNFRVAALVSNGFLSRFRYGVDLARRRVWLVEPGPGH